MDRNDPNLELSSDSSDAVRSRSAEADWGLQDRTQPLMQVFLKAGDMDIKAENFRGE